MNAILWQQFIQDHEEIEARITGEPEIIKVTPAEIYKQFDSIPVAASNLMNKSVKLQNISQFAQLFGQSPFVDAYELISAYAELIELPPSIVFDKPKNAMTQDEENLILLGGEDVPVNLWDNHQQHIQDVEKAKQSPATRLIPDEMKPVVLMALNRHAQMHMQAMQAIQQGMIQQGGTTQQAAQSTEQKVEAESQSFADAIAPNPMESMRKLGGNVEQASY